MQIRFIKLSPEAKAPKKAHLTDAGFDLTATSRAVDRNGALVYGTGIAVEIPCGYVGLVFPRSSIARYDLTLTNCVGVIDAGYRGEIMAKFKPAMAYDPDTLSPSSDMAGHSLDVYEIGERIAQLIIIPIPDVVFTESSTLDDSDRGKGGYGSSGK